MLELTWASSQEPFCTFLPKATVSKIGQSWEYLHNRNLKVCNLQLFFSRKLLVKHLSSVQSCPTLCDPMNCSTPGLPVHHQLLEFTQTHVHWVGDAIQPSHPLSSPSPAPNPSQHQGFFQWVNSCMRWPKYWSFSLSISPSKEIPGLISFRMDWVDLLAVQGTSRVVITNYLFEFCWQ